jgi:hypothetical protein
VVIGARTQVCGGRFRRTRVRQLAGFVADPGHLTRPRPERRPATYSLIDDQQLDTAPVVDYLEGEIELAGPRGDARTRAHDAVDASDACRRARRRRSDPAGPARVQVQSVGPTRLLDAVVSLE